MKKVLVSIILAFCIVCGVCVGVGLSFDYKPIDMVYVNEVIQSLKNGEEPPKIKYDYVLVDKTGKVIAHTTQVTDMVYQTRLSKAYAAGDIVVDYDENSKLIFYARQKENFYNMRNEMVWFVVAACILLAIVIIAIYIVLWHRMIKPFDKLKTFANEVSRGNLDSPLLLDKYLTFGAFGEAFDIMRNNLRETKIAEQNAQLDRCRLLQEIGHEVKNPLATIKAVAECGYAASGHKYYLTILDKVTATNNLMNDFYQKALEEEGQLNVFITKFSAQDLAQIITTSDYNQRVILGEIPICDVLFDKNRMMQIVDNIIANSYKYADTEINVDMKIAEQKLEVTFKDKGEGVEPEQLSYIMDRFYRGEKTAEKLGQGLGLNISRKLIMRMGGEMECYNDNGFVVKLKMPIYNNIFEIKKEI